MQARTEGLAIQERIYPLSTPIAVKVTDDRANELMPVKTVNEAVSLQPVSEGWRMENANKRVGADSWISHSQDERDIETREVYAHAGLALYLAQCLEHEVINSLGLAECIRLLRTNWPSTESEIAEYQTHVDRAWDEAFQQTLGKLVSSLGGSGIQIPASLISDLHASLNARNRLVHRYFREQAGMWFTSEGRSSMAEELKAMQEQFSRTDRELHEATSKIRSSLGITEEAVRLAAERTYDGWRE